MTVTVYDTSSGVPTLYENVVCVSALDSKTINIIQRTESGTVSTNRSIGYSVYILYV